MGYFWHLQGRALRIWTGMQNGTPVPTPSASPSRPHFLRQSPQVCGYPERSARNKLSIFSRPASVSRTWVRRLSVGSGTRSTSACVSITARQPRAVISDALDASHRLVRDVFNPWLSRQYRSSSISLPGSEQSGPNISAINALAAMIDLHSGAKTAGSPVSSSMGSMRL